MYHALGACFEICRWSNDYVHMHAQRGISWKQNLNTQLMWITGHLHVIRSIFFIARIVQNRNSPRIQSLIRLQKELNEWQCSEKWKFFFSVPFVFVVLFKCNKFDEDVFPHQNLVVTMICRNLLKRVCYLIASSKSVHAEETKKN